MLFDIAIVSQVNKNIMKFNN